MGRKALPVNKKKESIRVENSYIRLAKELGFRGVGELIDTLIKQNRIQQGNIKALQEELVGACNRIDELERINTAQ